MGFWYWLYVITAVLYALNEFLNEVKRVEQEKLKKSILYYFFYVVFDFLLMPFYLILKILRKIR